MYIVKVISGFGMNRKVKTSKRLDRQTAETLAENMFYNDIEQHEHVIVESVDGMIVCEYEI